MLNETEMVELEALVDRYSLSDVIDALASIAHAKADHLRSNWQDDRSAIEWDAAAKRIGKVSPWLTHLGP